MQNFTSATVYPQLPLDRSTLIVGDLSQYDSISMYSGSSSVVDSEFMASEIRRHERQTNQLPPPLASNNQINLQISVINNGKFINLSDSLSYRIILCKQLKANHSF